MRKTGFSRRAILAGTGVAFAARRAKSMAREKRIGIPWPVFDASEEKAVLEVLRSGHWGRNTGRKVIEFEERYKALTGAQYCLATANGTSALIAAMNAIEVGPGDEVILPPYTFVATLNAILLQHALPVFVDSDRETFQMDASKLASRITPATVAVVPVHLGGSAADLDTIIPLAREKKIKVIEDACQAHLGEWRGKKVGTLGDAGCFSFQASKNLNSGEGGALTSNDEHLFDRAFAFHGNGRARRISSMSLSGYASNGANLRLTEFQGAILMAQMMRLEAQSRRRDENAAYLTKLLSEIPGVSPQKLYPGCTRNAWHLYMFRYDPQMFEGLSRGAFLKAMQEEGVPCSGGYSPLNREPFLANVLKSRHYIKIYGESRLKEWHETNHCPENDRLCSEAVWLTQTMLLGAREEMEQIADAVRKVRSNAAALKRQSA